VVHRVFFPALGFRRYELYNYDYKYVGRDTQSARKKNHSALAIWQRLPNGYEGVSYDREKTRLGKGSNNMEFYPALSSHSQKILLRSNGEHTLFLKQQN
jgi:hypothetical protein